MEKHHSKHHIKNLFRKDKDLSDLDSRSSSHLNLSKLFHKDKDKDKKKDLHATSSAADRSSSPLLLVSQLHLSGLQQPRLLVLTKPITEGHVVGKVKRSPDGKISIILVGSSADISADSNVPRTPKHGHAGSPSPSANTSPGAQVKNAPVNSPPLHGRPSSQNNMLMRSPSDAGSLEGDGKILSNPLASSLKRNNTNGMLATPGRQSVRRAETLAHYGPRPQNSWNNIHPCRKVSQHSNHEKIKYNPYGINKLDLNQATAHLNLFYLKGGPDLGGRVLSNPVANPNDYLPEDLKEAHVNFLEDFEYENMDKKIGDGGSGDVRKVTLCGNKRKHFALKKFSLFSKETDEEFYKRAAKEYIISRRVVSLRHVVSTLALLRIQSQGNMTRGWGMVMEFCSGGDLFNMIVRLGWKRTHLSERYCLFKQIAYGVKFLHENDIVHKDLKPENILLDHNGLAKLCDFGVSDYGHEEAGNFESPIKLSTAYVGSPPYSPPEVMLLKDLSSSEVKKNPYDPFKMDHWSLGMLLFCLVYSGVPFQQATVHDINFRDYKFNRDRYCSDNPGFKNNKEFLKGPGSEFKWASLFHSSGAARVAWKLCDPSASKRYDLDLLFADPWFTSLEMCIYEHPDQTVDPIIYGSSNPSRTSSTHTSRAPSRKNTISGNSAQDDTPFTPVRSMLDMHAFDKDARTEKEDKAAPPELSNLAQEDTNNDTASMKSNYLLEHTPLKLKVDDHVQRSNSEFLLQLLGSNGSMNKMRSMLDTNPSSEKIPLSRVVEAETQPKSKHSPLLGVLKEISSRTEKESEGIEMDNFCLDHVLSFPPRPVSNLSAFSLGAEKPSDTEEKLTTLYVIDEDHLHSPENMVIDNNGLCDLGYKIKKHNHMDVTNIHIGSSLSRKK